MKVKANNKKRITIIKFQALIVNSMENNYKILKRMYLKNCFSFITSKIKNQIK